MKIFLGILKKIFGSEDVPFSNYSDAKKWIEDFEHKFNQNEEMQSKSMEFWKLYKNMQQKINSGEIIGSIKMNISTLPYDEMEIEFKDGENRKGLLNAFTESSKELTILQQETKIMSLTSGFSQYDLVKYILSDEKPAFSRYSIQELYGLKSRKTIQVQINASDLSLDEIKSIYYDYKKAFNAKKQKKLTQKQQDIYDFIRKIGKPPEHKGLAEYYSMALELWNIKYKDKTYKNKKYEFTTWQGLWKSYTEIERKLNISYKGDE